MQDSFQDNEVRRVATDIVEATTATLTNAIVERLGIEKEYAVTNEDGTIEQLPVEFERAYKLLRDANQTINHEFVIKDGKPVLTIRFFTLDSSVEYAVENKYEFSITKV